jgi:hypothetical protein
LETHPLPTIPATEDIDGPSCPASVDAVQRDCRGDTDICKRGTNCKTNPIVAVDPQ